MSKRFVVDYDARCKICDFHYKGLCSNYELDKLLSDGSKNLVVWDKLEHNFICRKCIDAVVLAKEDYKEEEKERPLLLEYHDDTPKTITPELEVA